MKIVWLGHSSFLIKIGQVTVLTDPFDDTPGYKFPAVEADVILVSHDHHDHNAVERVKGKPLVITRSERTTVDDIVIYGVNTFHDQSGGRQRGKNIAFVIEAEGRRLCHLGDLGHILSAAQIEEIGRVDILMIPVGGTYTITAQEARQVIRLIKPGVSIPMHYKTDVCKFPISPLQDFVRHFGEIIKVPFLELPVGGQISLAEVAVLDYSYIDRSNV